jgi:small subunit ribosomal protein S16
MSTRIRLRKIGRKKLPLYRIVVTDKESPRDGRFIEILGTYDPKQEGAKKVVVDVAKAKSWIARGATPTDTVEALLKSAGVLPQSA